jgi:hypothetical protein
LESGTGIEGRGSDVPGETQPQASAPAGLAAGLATARHRALRGPVIAACEREPANSNNISGMACQWDRGVTRRCLRLAAIGVAAGIAGLLAAPATAATATPGSPTSPGAAAGPAAATGSAASARRAGTRQRPWIAINSITPGYEQFNGKVTIIGMVTNPTGSPLHGMSVQLYSSMQALTGPEMNSYLTAAEPTGLDSAIIGAQHNLAAPVPAHGTEQWTMTLPASQVGMRTFGVYPLAAHLVSGAAAGFLGTQVDYARTFLPYWPGKSAGKTVPPAHPVSIAWVWPLIDTPQQTVCGTLTSNELAGSVATGGRLNSLLAAGQNAPQAMLTWAIDPALLSDVSVMSGPYRVTGTGKCSGGKREPARGAATAWLAGVQRVAAQQDFFTTPYADVDVAALAHGGLDNELQAAITDGRLAATQLKVPGSRVKVLGHSQRVTPDTGSAIAWPAGGIADYGLLGGLAAHGIKTVIMNSSLIHTPATVATVNNALGGQTTVLRASDMLTKVLSTRRDEIPGLLPASYATPPAAHAQAQQAAAFGKQQWFLAETAMIAANAPAAGRSIVVAPPRHWNPLPQLASGLLNETVSTPWLQPATLAGLVSGRSQTRQVSPRFPTEKKVSRGELSPQLLKQVKRLYGQIRLLDSILPRSGHRYLSTAVDTVESSAWRGRKANERPAKQLVHADLAYVLNQLHQVKIVGSSRVTLGGQNGVVPVSILNGLSQPVTVKLVATAPAADHVTIGKITNPITVQGHTQRTIKISVTAAQGGSTTLTLYLTTTSGKALPAKLPPLTVVATHFGTLAIVIITIALVVFLLTATARAIRRGGPQGGSAAEAEELDAMPSPREAASAGDEPDTVVPGGADERQPAKEADEHASTPGTADRS